MSWPEITSLMKFCCIGQINKPWLFYILLILDCSRGKNALDTHVLNQSVISYIGIYCDELHCFGRWKKIFNFSAVCLSEPNSEEFSFPGFHFSALCCMTTFGGEFYRKPMELRCQKRKENNGHFHMKAVFLFIENSSKFHSCLRSILSFLFFLSLYTLSERLPLSLYQSRYFLLQFNCFGNFILSFLINWH